MVVLMLAPLAGVVALAVEVGDVASHQRTLQHAADSAALAAATGNDTNTYSGVYGYIREAKAVAFNYPIGNATTTTVTPSLADCPGSSNGSNDCYKVAISRPFNLYLARMVGMNSMTASVVAFARTSAKVDLCLVSLGSGGITTDGKSTGFGTCYAEALGTGNQKCTSVTFAGLWSPNAPTACNSSPFKTIPSSTPNPITSIASSIPTTSQVPCSASITNLSWYPVTVTGDTTQYARVCSDVTLSSDLNVSAAGNNRAIILDNATIDMAGNNVNLTGVADGVGVTVISTYSSCASSCALKAVFTNGAKNTTSTIKIQAPSINGGGAFDNYAIYDDDSSKVTSAAAFNPPNNYGIDINITGTIYQIMRDITSSGNLSSSIGGASNCIAIVVKSFYSNGGKLANNPNSGCAADGYILPTQTISNVALVQ
jgi:hypothetical protein